VPGLAARNSAYTSADADEAFVEGELGAMRVGNGAYVFVQAALTVSTR
jgi:hypothetical protein